MSTAAAGESPLTDLDACHLCQMLYDADSGSDSFDDLIWPEADDGVCVAIKHAGDDTFAVWRGSVTLQDWYRDGISELFKPMPGFRELGLVPAGFEQGMPETFDKIVPLLTGRRIWSVGHSLGAARAQEFGAMLAARRPSLPLYRVVGLGPPRVGMQTMRKLVAHVPWHLYKNGTDPVADVPTDPPWTHMRALTGLDEPAEPTDTWGPLRQHHVELYEAGLAKLFPPAAA